MNVLVFCIISAFFWLQVDSLTYLEKVQTCIKREGATKDQAADLALGDFKDTDRKVKCFANCFLEESGVVANGQIKPDAVLAKLGPIAGEAKVKKVQAKCDSIKGADKCDTSYLLYKCYNENRAKF
ncbi:general odorant-binding protein 56d-like [Drosophila eugracilis]|uniref:general odorant-binding protein 56d-like n=1 Tax=Drosophila eugracilis TaxID=29029 RepID=UPI0007E6BFCA|nr:general odorant-binding protein 56d-like [Drosophila eugracilis]